MQQLMKSDVQINVLLKELGTALCTIRKETKMSIVQVAEMINEDRRTVSRIESGKYHNILPILKYCELLGVGIRLKPV